jgi:hypothetical protein
MTINKPLTLFATLILIAIFLIIAYTGQASGYEISIYQAYPWYFWLLLIACSSIGIFLLVEEALSQKKTGWWQAGLAIVIVSNSILLLLPLFRGYYAHGFFDTLVHLGFIRDIEMTGHFGEAGVRGENFYPATHILAVSLAYTSGLNANIVIQIIPPLFFSFYVLSLYHLAKSLTQNMSQSLLITAFGALPLFTSTNEILTSFFPRLMTVFLIPFVMDIYYRSSLSWQYRSAYKKIFVTILLIQPFMHPYDGGLFLIGIFLSIYISLQIYRKASRYRIKESNPVILELQNSIWNTCLILSVMWFFWFSNFSMFGLQVRRVRDFLAGDIRASEAERYFFWLQRAEVPFEDAVTLFLKMFGNRLMYFIISSVISVMTWWKLFLVRDRIAPTYVVFSFLFIVSVALLVISFFSPYEIGYARFIGYAVFASTMVNGMGLYQLHQRIRKTKFLTLATTIFLIVSLSLGVFNSYYSPFINAANQQVTVANIKGMSWFLERRDESLLTDEIAFTQYAHARALHGCQKEYKNIRYPREIEPMLPEHFGYTKYPTYGASIHSDRYLLINKLSRIYFTERIPQYPNAWRWTPADFERLENDYTVSVVYRNGDFEIFYVKANPPADE